MKLTFDAGQLMPLVSAAIDNWKRGTVPTYGQEEPAPAGFWLVGDHGVYLMHNGIRPEGKKPIVVYANECNPETMEFDEWWGVKNDTFGGDDGVEFIGPKLVLECALQSRNLEIEFRGDSMIISVAEPGA